MNPEDQIPENLIDDNLNSQAVVSEAGVPPEDGSAEQPLVGLPVTDPNSPSIPKFKDPQQIEKSYGEAERKMHEATQEAAKARKALDLIAQANGMSGADELLSAIESPENPQAPQGDNLPGEESTQYGQGAQTPNSFDDFYQSLQPNQGAQSDPEIASLKEQVTSLLRDREQSRIEKFQAESAKAVKEFAATNPDAALFEKELFYQTTLPVHQGKTVEQVFNETYAPMIDRIKGKTVERLDERSLGNMVSQGDTGGAINAPVDYESMTADQMKAVLAERGELPQN